MPELFSRMDQSNWLTPSIADILDQGSSTPGGDGSIRQRMLTIQHELGELNTPARIVNMRSTPSYTLYVAKPETIGKSGERHLVTSSEIKQSIRQLAEEHNDEWLLGFVPQLQEEGTVGILLRAEEHQPLSLRRLLVRSSFRKHPSTLAFVAGITLEQKLIVRDLREVGHLLILGSDNAKQHFIRSLILTLILLNTPGEVRIALAGGSSEGYKTLVRTPHALGRILTSPTEGQRLLEGLAKEIQRRQQTFAEHQVETIDEYNALRIESGLVELPRIVLLIDSLSDSNWYEARGAWTPSLTQLLEYGRDCGIHLIMTTEDESYFDLPSRYRKAIPSRILLGSVARDSDFLDHISNFHGSLLRFVDGFVHDQDNEPIPIEMCAVTSNEIARVADYWREMAKKRYQDTQLTKSSSRTGVTGVLARTATQTLRPAPPQPEKPSVATLTKATQILETQTNRQSAVGVAIKPRPEPPSQPEEKSVDKGRTQPLAPMRDMEHEFTIIEQATALAAYLGWLSVGALQDIFGLSLERSSEIIDELQAQLILEKSDGAVSRFIKLIQEDE